LQAAIEVMFPISNTGLNSNVYSLKYQRNIVICNYFDSCGSRVIFTSRAVASEGCNCGCLQFKKLLLIVICFLYSWSGPSMYQ